MAPDGGAGGGSSGTFIGVAVFLLILLGGAAAVYFLAFCGKAGKAACVSPFPACGKGLDKTSGHCCSSGESWDTGAKACKGNGGGGGQPGQTCTDPSLGGPGQKPCADGSCRSGLGTSNGLCCPYGQGWNGSSCVAACGGESQPACSGASGAICKKGQLISLGYCCAQGEGWNGKTCAVCGGNPGDPVCPDPNPPCSGPLVPSSGRCCNPGQAWGGSSCDPCGGEGQVACGDPGSTAGQSCSSGLIVTGGHCCKKGETWEGGKCTVTDCGGSGQEKCTTGQPCKSGLLPGPSTNRCCEKNFKYDTVAQVCTPCGRPYQPVCDQGAQCDENSQPDYKTKQVCEPCGGWQQIPCGDKQCPNKTPGGPDLFADTWGVDFRGVYTHQFQVCCYEGQQADPDTGACDWCGSPGQFPCGTDKNSGKCFGDTINSNKWCCPSGGSQDWCPGGCSIGNGCACGGTDMPPCEQSGTCPWGHYVYHPKDDSKIEDSRCVPVMSEYVADVRGSPSHASCGRTPAYGGLISDSSNPCNGGTACLNLQGSPDSCCPPWSQPTQDSGQPNYFCEACGSTVACKGGTPCLPGYVKDGDFSCKPQAG